jgi:hypothetical protein
MACIIKLPNETRGVISFTSPESREVVKGETLTYLQANRKDWIYLLHHNWQPCQHNPFYDTSLCNTIDLQGGGNCLDMDCCNFSPKLYRPSTDKTFDVLFVTRAVTFKRLNVFYDVCKELLAKKPDIKILLICSVPEVDCDPANPNQIYLDRFTREERKNFLALFFDYDYPFSVDKYYLGHFYKSSKVFLHTANEERHPRVCSYAWASGIPVVGYRPLATFLSEDFAVETFTNKLVGLSSTLGEAINTNNIFKRNLDFRMGRHCTISLGDNSLPIGIPELMERAKKFGFGIDTDNDDLELELVKYE